MTKEKRKLFCFGYGYVSEHLGEALKKSKEYDWSLSGTVREAAHKRKLDAKGIDITLFEYTRPLPDVAQTLKDVTHILFCAPPSAEGSAIFSSHGEEIANLKNLQWAGYMSTTGVYGNRSGGWVDENSDINPTTIRGTRRALAEQQWCSLYKAQGLPIHSFRLSGIYGPGRSAIDSVVAGMSRRVEKKGHAFSRIHIDDIVQTVMASMAKPNAGNAYNLADDFPAPSHEVIAYACDLLGVPCPPLVPFDEVDLAPITQSFYDDNKRVRNDKIKQELGVKLKYPSYREGLLACLESDKEVLEKYMTNSSSA